MKYVKSPIFYMGNKYDLMKQLMPLFPKNIDTFACDTLKNKNIIFKNENAFDILQETTFNKDDFIYLDPPYSNTTAIYNEKRAFGGWTIKDDYNLFDILEELNKKGIKWGLSNVFRNKGIENKHLIEWCNKNKWNVNHLNKNYASLGKGNAKSDEVYICNYDTNESQLTIFDILGESNE